MKKLISTVFVGFLASQAVTSQAAGQTVYVVVDKNGNEQVFDRSPVDLSYPPRGQKLSVIDISKGEKNEGIPISAQEYTARQNQTRLIITNKPDPATLTAQERARLENRDANVRAHENRASDLFYDSDIAFNRGRVVQSIDLEKRALREESLARREGNSKTSKEAW